MDFGAKNVLFVRYRAVFRWTTLVLSPFILLRTKSTFSRQLAAENRA